MPLTFKTRLFFVLFLLGGAGILSLLLIDLAALIESFPNAHAPNIPIRALILLSLIQPTLILAGTTILGVILAPQVGLMAPFAQGIATGKPSVSLLKPQIVPGLLGGILGGGLIISITLLFKPLLRTDTVSRISSLANVVPLPTRLLYGGITEEVLLRWGFMTLVVWILWRLLQRRNTAISPVLFIASIGISSLVFAIGHLPIAFMLVSDPPAALIVFVVLANSVFGLIAGYLYWKKGLESSMIAHITTHLLLGGAAYAGLYF